MSFYVEILFNFRGESILLFLVQTVGRQTNEQRQYNRSSRQRTASRKTPSSDIGNVLMKFISIIIIGNFKGLESTP